MSYRREARTHFCITMEAWKGLPYRMLGYCTILSTLAAGIRCQYFGRKKYWAVGKKGLNVIIMYKSDKLLYLKYCHSEWDNSHVYQATKTRICPPPQSGRVLRLNSKSDHSFAFLMFISLKKGKATGHLSIFYFCLWEPFSEVYVQVSTWLPKSLYQYLEKKHTGTGQSDPQKIYIKRQLKSTSK